MPTITVDEETWDILRKLSNDYKLSMGLLIRIIMGLEEKYQPLREQILKDIRKYIKNQHDKR